MSDEHYFSEHPTARGGKLTIEVTLRGHRLHLTTGAGVFSRFRVDRGTRLLINEIEIEPDETVLDLGCGYGVVGIAAAKLAPQGRVTLVDINERAVELAKANVQANGVENAEVLQGDGFAPLQGRRFDVIALNPPIRAGNAVVHRLIEQAKEHLAPAGRFHLVGRTQQGVVRLSAKMAVIFGQVRELGKGGGYRVYVSHLQEEQTPERTLDA